MQNQSVSTRSLDEEPNGVNETGSGGNAADAQRVPHEDGTHGKAIDTANHSDIAHNTQHVDVAGNAIERSNDASAACAEMDLESAKETLTQQPAEPPAVGKAHAISSLNNGHAPVSFTNEIENVDTNTAIANAKDTQHPKSFHMLTEHEISNSEQVSGDAHPMDLNKQVETESLANGNAPTPETDAMETVNEHKQNGDDNNAQHSRKDETGNDETENDEEKIDEVRSDKGESEDHEIKNAVSSKENGHEVPHMENPSDGESREGDENVAGKAASDVDQDDDDDPFAGLEDIAAMDLYEIANYTFGKKDSISTCKALSDLSPRAISDSLRREYAQRGMRRSVRAVMLVHEHNFPHVLLLQRSDGKGEFVLPGGRLRPGESFEQGLERKLKSKLGRPDVPGENDVDASLEVGDKRKMNALKLVHYYVFFISTLHK